MARNLLKDLSMSHLRPPRKLLSVSAATATAFVIAGCHGDALGSYVEPCDACDPVPAEDGGDAASDASREAGPGVADAGVIAPPLDGGDAGAADGGDGG